MDIPPELRDAAAKEGPAAVGGLIGAMLAASGAAARMAYFVGGYLLARYAGPLVNTVTGFGAEVGMILAGSLGLLALERFVAFLKAVDGASIGKSLTARIRKVISGFGPGERGADD